MSDQLGAVLSKDSDRVDTAVAALVGAHRARGLPVMERLWSYFRNPLELVGRSGSAVGGDSQVGWYRMAQEIGLPRRVRGTRVDGVGPERHRREVVIENDIGWRVAAMVDFMFGEPVRIGSLASDAPKRDMIEGVLERVWERSGGIALMQDLATLGHVFGHVDLVVRVDEAKLAGAGVEDAHEAVSIELVEARRGIPVLDESDYREIGAYVVHVDRGSGEDERGSVSRSALARLRGRGKKDGGGSIKGSTELITRDGSVVYEDGVRVGSGDRVYLRGVVPVVHIQNVSQPFVYSGLGEVEALIPLQDELNTRLSDRANRVTLQSFKMYLARGIEGFDGSAVGPGTVWSTDNPDATIVGFGGDASSPSEDRHIEEIREAMDKVSGVPPLAGGVVKAKLGNLSSANALRVTLMGLIARTKRKRVTYGRGLEQVSALVLRALDEAGVLRTKESERGVRVRFGALGPIGDFEELERAQQQLDIGADEEAVLDALGLDDEDPGVV